MAVTSCLPLTMEQPKVWDVESGAALSAVRGKYVFSDDENDYGPIKLTPDGRFAVWLAQHTLKDVGSTPSTFSISVWDLNSDERPVRQLGLDRQGWSRYDDMSLSPDSKYVVTPFGDGSLGLWDIESGKFLRALGQHSGPVTDTAVAPDGRCVVSVSGAEGTPYGLYSRRVLLSVWDSSTGEKLHTLTPSFLNSKIGFTADGRSLL